MGEERYLPISCYGVIGNLRTAALVGRNGSIDWCCFPHFDSPSAFGAILDTRVGGRFQVSPSGAPWGDQEYILETNVLRTRFVTEQGELEITDLMPLWKDLTYGDECIAPPEIHRLLVCNEGECDVELEWSPRFDYGRVVPCVSTIDGGWSAWAGATNMSLGGLERIDGKMPYDRASLIGQFRMVKGERKAIVVRWDSHDTKHDVNDTVDAIDKTAKAWRTWVHGSNPTHHEDWAREWYPTLIRSELALKVLISAETGAIVAAPTTSLPEALGGSRNYDYRYTWIRDASLTAQALISLGHEKEAVDLLLWIERVSASHFEELMRPQIMYGIHGESDLREEVLHHLEGYMGSHPVRIGNLAAEQLQLEVYGEILNTAYELARRGIVLEAKIMRFLSKITDLVSAVWREPDHGIWEVRGNPRHFTYSKIMLWVALDRAIKLDAKLGMEGDKESWRRTREEIRQEVLERGFDKSIGSFVQSYGSSLLDASNLRIPLLEFLPLDDPRIMGTINKSLEILTEKGLVHRYRHDELRHWGEEGAFSICTSWMIDALVLTGRVKEARQLLENLVGLANPLGLFSEQIDPHTGTFLGNFPQAFTHIGLINNIFYLAYAEGRHKPPYPLMGTREHRGVVNRVILTEKGKSQ